MINRKAVSVITVWAGLGLLLSACGGGQQAGRDDDWQPQLSRFNKHLYMSEIDQVLYPDTNETKTILDTSEALTENCMVKRGFPGRDETKIVLGTGKLQIKVTVNTATFLQLKAGQPVKMSSGQWEENSSIPELPTQPDPVDKKEGNTEANYTFILPTQNPPNVGPEIPIQCEVQLGDQTVYPKVVPASAVHYEGDHTVVYVVDKKQPEKIRREKVKVIVSGDTAAAIEANIPVGTEVYTDEQS